MENEKKCEVLLKSLIIIIYTLVCLVRVIRISTEQKGVEVAYIRVVIFGLNCVRLKRMIDCD